MEMRKYIVLIVLGLFLASCNKEEKKAVTDSRQLDAFHSIELNDVFEVGLVEDSVFFIEIIGAPNMIEGVEAYVQDSVLYLDRKNGNRWYRPQSNEVQVIIHAKPLRLVTANKTCHVGTVTPITSFEFGLIFKDKASQGDLELNCNSFYFWNQDPCGGLLKLRGNASFLKLWNHAIMTVDGSDLISDYALVENDSKGDCTVNVSSQLDYRIKASGNINVYGNPSTINVLEESGEGQVVYF